MRTIAFLLAATFALAAAAAPRSTVDDLAIAQQTFRLDNGLTVVVHEDHSVPLVSVNIWYHVGSRDERRGRTGFAHLFEHFFFNGSEHYPHGFREAMDDLGATNRNGTTNTDRTNFFEDVPVSALERTLYLEADRMGFLAAQINQAMLERERGVVQNEKRQGENQPYGRVFARIVETMYPYSHPYSWSTIGSMADLDAATLDDVRDWYARSYGPSNAVLVLAGDITVARAKELVQKYFGGIPTGSPVPRLERWVPVLDADVRDTMQDRVPQARIYRAWHVPGWGTTDAHALEVWAATLAGSDAAPLNRRLVFERQLATDVSVSVDASEIAGLLYATVSVKPGVDPAVAERELDAVIAEALAKDVPAATLARAKTRLFAEFTRRIERLGGFARSDVLAESATYGGRADAYLDRLRDIDAATAPAVRAVAAKWLGRHHYTLVVTPFAAATAARDALDRTQLPELGEPAGLAFPRIQRTKLANGMDVLLLERHNVPLVTVSLVVDAGIASDPPAASGTARLALDLMSRGSRTRDAYAVAGEAEALGAEFFTYSTLDLSVFELSALTAKLGPSLELFADVARHPAFDAGLLEIVRKQQLAAIAQERASPFGAALRVAPRVLYGPGHPYAQPASGTGDEAVVAKLARGELVAWHGKWFVPSNATLIVAGDVTLAEVKPRLEAAFGDWRGAQKPAKNVAATESGNRGKVFIVDRPGAPQSVVVAAHLTAPGGAADDLAIETAMRNFGGIATSRLNRNLRLDKHWSYGTTGSI
ncbi:MAG TPA: pitrilysin family protein, partial [Xanthomonadales bacterium]|nr:pitrilysin family protein [Xanthomonadales bacterium]